MISHINSDEFLQSGTIKNGLPRLGPRISIYLPINEIGDRQFTLSVRMMGALRKAESRLSRSEKDAVQLPCADLWQYAQRLHIKPSPGSIAVFDTPGYTAIVSISGQVQESIHCGEDFYILPLLALMQRDQPFHLLALSEKQVRLFRCTLESVTEVPLPGNFPQSQLEAGQFSAPDHMLENRSAAGREPGANRRIHFTTSTEDQKYEARQKKFFTGVDRAIQPILKKASSPLMLATIRRESTLYREISTYPQLLKDNVEGSPDHLSAQDLHQRAVEVWERYLNAEQQRAWQEALAAKDAGRTLEDAMQLLHAADHGYIHKLLVSSLQEGDAADELKNHLALETLRHSGQVIVMTQPDPPLTSALAIVRHKSASHISNLDTLQSVQRDRAKTTEQ